MKKSVSRRDAFRALAVASPVLAAVPAACQTPDQEVAAAEARLNASIEALRAFPLPAEAESAAIFKP